MPQHDEGRGREGSSGWQEEVGDRAAPTVLPEPLSLQQAGPGSLTQAGSALKTHYAQPRNPHQRRGCTMYRSGESSQAAGKEQAYLGHTGGSISDHGKRVTVTRK